MIKSPYADEIASLDKYKDSFDTFDDLPASSAWMQTIGAALGKKFGITVQINEKQWEIHYKEKLMKCGAIDDIYTRRGVLGLLMNGIGRLAFGIHFPQTKQEATKFATDHKIDPKLGKHFGSLARMIDEVRTDDEIAHNYAGGVRVVDTMHAQAYEGAVQALRMMAMDMKMRKEMARESLQHLSDLMFLVNKVSTVSEKKTGNKSLSADVKAWSMDKSRQEMSKATIWNGQIGDQLNASPAVGVASSRFYATVLMALYPNDAPNIIKVLVRGYERNIDIFGNLMQFAGSTVAQEKELLGIAGKIVPLVEEMKQFASHTGGHAQYVVAKTEQYYHGLALGIDIVSPYFDTEAKFLDVEEANKAASSIAMGISKNGITKNVGDSIKLAKELLPLLEPFPFLDLNDKGKGDNSNGTMSQRGMGAGGNAPKKKRQKEKEKQSKSERRNDQKKLNAIDNKKNQEEINAERGGYSILSNSKFDPLRKYAYIIGPYLSRIQTTASRMRRILKVNDPLGLRGAYRRGKKLNQKILYRHRLNDYKLFSRKEQDKDLSYGFVLMADLSGSTEHPYSSGPRLIQDEMLAAAFLMAEITDRIGEKIMTSIGFFSNGAQVIKRPGHALHRSSILTKITDWSGGTNVEAAGRSLDDELQEMDDFKVKNKTVIFITDGGFRVNEFLTVVQMAKKYNASIAYFQIGDSGMCIEVERFVAHNAKSVRVRTKNVETKNINHLPEEMAQLMKETIGVRER